MNLNKAKNALMMINKHDHKRNKKKREFKEGDNITVKITRIDRDGHNFTRLSAKVCKISAHIDVFYRILTEYGILNDDCRA